MTEITDLLHNLAMSDFSNLIRFLVSTGHSYLALCVIVLLALWVLRHLLPIRLNFDLSVGDRQEQRHDKAS